MGLRVSRRGVLRAAAVVGAGTAAGGVALARLTGAEAATTHPGMLHTQADLDRMAAQVAAGAAPWQAGWNRLVANAHAQSTWTPRPVATVVRGGTGQNYSLLYNDIAAAYQNALRWRVRGNTAYADKARDILNA
jgi:hypothetical protein